MARYIDADKLIEAIRKYADVKHSNGEQIEYVNGILKSISVINEQPTADVAEVKHAKWEINSDGYYPYCSNCMTEPKNGVMSKHCPECGADMRGEIKDGK